MPTVMLPTGVEPAGRFACVITLGAAAPDPRLSRKSGRPEATSVFFYWARCHFWFSAEWQV